MAPNQTKASNDHRKTDRMSNSIFERDDAQAGIIGVIGTIASILILVGLIFPLICHVGIALAGGTETATGNSANNSFMGPLMPFLRFGDGIFLWELHLLGMNFSAPIFEVMA